MVNKPILSDDTVTLYLGDCIEVMAQMEAYSIDAIVCDPPYGLEFMGKSWDRFAPPKTSAARGAYIQEPDPGPWGRRERVSFAGDNGHRNEHCRICGKWRISSNRCQCDAPDWEYRPRHSASPSMLAFQEWCAEWAHEAFRILKPGGHLLAFGGTRTYHRLTCGIEDAGFEIRDCLAWLYGSGFPKSQDTSKAIDKTLGSTGTYGEPKSAAHAELSYIPATAEALEWQGWGTALKPAHEPIVLARKPLTTTVAANVLEHGTGALNIDACRIEGEPVAINKLENWSGFGQEKRPDYEATVNTSGRWPANVILDEEAGAILDKQTGILTSGTSDGFVGPYTAEIYGQYAQNQIRPEVVYGDSGGASRFFYCAKADKQDRGEGNDHPTVKPVDLMRWLVRLVTPPNGIVLDPFAGSGTTLQAAITENRKCIWIEKDEHYCDIILKRLAKPIEVTMFDV